MKKFFKVKKSLSFDEGEDPKLSSTKSKQNKKSNNSHIIKQSASFHPIQSRPLPPPQSEISHNLPTSTVYPPGPYFQPGPPNSQHNSSPYATAYGLTTAQSSQRPHYSNAQPMRNSSLDRKVASVPYPNSFHSDASSSSPNSTKQEKLKAKELFAAVKMRKTKTPSEQSINEIPSSFKPVDYTHQMKSSTLPGNMKPGATYPTSDMMEAPSHPRTKELLSIPINNPSNYSGFSNNAFQYDYQSFMKNTDAARSGAGFAIYAHRVQMQQKFYEQQQARMKQANLSNSSLNDHPNSQRNSPHNFSERIPPNLPQSQSFPVSMSSEISNFPPSQQNSLTNLQDSPGQLLHERSNQTNSFRSLSRQVTNSSSVNYNSDFEGSEYSSHYGVVRRYTTDAEEADSEIYREAESLRGGLRGHRDNTPVGYFSETESSAPNVSNNNRQKASHQSLFYSTRRSNQALKYMPPLSGYANRNTATGQPCGELSVKLPYSTISHVIKEDSTSDKINENGEANRSNTTMSNCSGNCRSIKEEDQSQEIRKLRRELEIAHQKVTTLTSKLSANECTISAYEQSFSNMKNRLQSLNASATEKDNELQTLRSTISSLRREANLPPFSSSPTQGILKERAYSVEPSVSTPDLHTRSASLSTAVASTPPMIRASQGKQTPSESDNILQSAHSYSSLASNSTGASALEHQQSGEQTHSRRGPRKSWFRNSLGRAFRRKSKGSSEMEAMADALPIRHSGSIETVRPNSVPYTDKNEPSEQSENSWDLDAMRRELTEKNMMLTDLQLSALSSAHQVEQMKEQILNLKADKERLEQCLSSALSSRTGSEQTDRSSTAEEESDLTDTINSRLLVSPGQANEVTMFSKVSPDNDSGIGDQSGLSKEEDIIIDPSIEPAAPAKRVIVRVGALSHVTHQSEQSPSADSKSHTMLGCLCIDQNTSWLELENGIRKLFKSFTTHIDPSTRLGLSNDSIIGIQLGSSQIIRRDTLSSMKQSPHSFMEENSLTDSPSHGGGGVSDHFLTLIMRSIDNQSDLSKNSNLPTYLDALALETLVPRTILQRYIALVLEHKRIILCGPSGTGKTYLANRLADFLISKSCPSETATSTIARFKVEPKSSKELRAYLSNIADQSMRASGDGANATSSSKEQKPPSVVIIDNLHHVPCLADIFNSFLSSIVPSRCPYIIGTMNQSTFSTNNLQLHHNFRWVLCANHMEPVKGFLGRYLRRKLLQTEIVTKRKQEKLAKVVTWISSFWQMLNDFLESHASSDVTIGPRLFLPCPMNLDDSQVWLCDLWNYSLVPYLLEALREGIQTFGKRAVWRDPVDWILSTWPWSTPNNVMDEFSSPLIRLRPEDVGYDSQLFSGSSPLLSPPSPVTNSGAISSGGNKSSSGRSSANFHTNSPFSSKTSNFIYPPNLPYLTTRHHHNGSELHGNNTNGSDSYKNTLMQMKPLRPMSREHDVI